MASVPVFVSMPTKLNPAQQSAYAGIERSLQQLRLEPRTVGRSDHPLQAPLGEVYQLARQCSGGLILGFRQASASDTILFPDSEWRRTGVETHWPSAWNQLEAGILYSLGVPMLVFAESGVTGGIFDRSVGNLFIHEFSTTSVSEPAAERMSIHIQEWARRVRNFSMDESPKDWRK